MLVLAAVAMVLGSCNERATTTSDFVEDRGAVDLTDFLRLYEETKLEEYVDVRGKMRESMGENVKSGQRIGEPQEGLYMFRKKEHMLSLPQYADSEDPFVANIVDFYNCSAIVWNVWSNYEAWYRCMLNDKDFRTDMPRKLTASISPYVVKNADARKAVKEYIKKVSGCMKPVKGWEDDENPGKYESECIDSVTAWVNSWVTSDTMFVLPDEVDSIFRALSKDKIARYNMASEEERRGVVLGELAGCKTFDEQVSLLLAWADNANSMEDDAWIIAVAERLMESGKYSPYLYEVWRTWRALFQLEYGGLSRDSCIPNEFYNDCRGMCFETCMKWMAKHPDDVAGRVCTFALAEAVNIFRCGQFMFGNEAMLEMLNMMPNRE